MKALFFLLTSCLCFVFQSSAYAGAWVRNSAGKWFYFPNSWCSRFNIKEHLDQKSVDYCAINGVTLTPITYGQVVISTKKLGNGDVEVYDSANNEGSSHIFGI
jgi:hypothetical protein